jgi:hypothetical protein
LVSSTIDARYISRRTAIQLTADNRGNRRTTTPLQATGDFSREALGYNRRMFKNTDRRSSGALTATGIAVGLVILVAVGALVLTYKRWEGTPPTIGFDREFKFLGKKTSLTLNTGDEGTGLKRVQILLKHKDGETPLADDTFDRGSAPNSKS